MDVNPEDIAAMKPGDRLEVGPFRVRRSGNGSFSIGERGLPGDFVTLVRPGVLIDDGGTKWPSAEEVIQCLRSRGAFRAPRPRPTLSGLNVVDEGDEEHGSEPYSAEERW